MTKEELREHCEKQVKMCEEWAKGNNREPSGKTYEEHKLVLELIKASEQSTSDDCVSRQAVLDLATTIQTDDYSGNEIIDVVEVDDIKSLPLVTPTHCFAEVRFSKEDLREICNERIEIECMHGTCKDCKHNYKTSGNTFECSNGHRFALREPSTFYCADFEK